MKLIKTLFAFMLILSLLTASFCFSVSALVIYEGDFGFEVNTVKHAATLVSYTGDGGTITIPAYFQDYPVTVIDNNAFSENESITQVIFSDTNTTIDEYAFMNCTSLETVYIPENVVNIGDRAFAGCTSLKEVTMLSDIVSMPTNIFSGCETLENVTLSETVAEFGYGCFNGCSSLTDLSFVSQGALLNAYAFNATGAQSVVLSDSLLAIPNYAFTNCPALTTVTIPESVVLIQPYAFDRERVTIRCMPDSYAHIFAQENGVAYEFVPTYLLGDADGDGEIQLLDATIIQHRLAGIAVTDPDVVERNGDIEGEGLGISDATWIQRRIAQMEIPYEVGKTVAIYHE